MSADQKGFIVYGDTKAVVDELTDEQVGQLFRGMIQYFTEGKEPKFSGILKFVFIPIKQQMDRDADKYEKKCEKMRSNANKRWNNTNASKSNQKDANDANTKTNTNTNTNTDTDTTTTTNTNVRGGVDDVDDDDAFNIWKRMDADDVDAIYNEYPESGGNLIQTVYEDVKTKRKRVDSPVPYILGYAKRVGWDDRTMSGGAI